MSHKKREIERDRKKGAKHDSVMCVLMRVHFSIITLFNTSTNPEKVTIS